MTALQTCLQTKIPSVCTVFIFVWVQDTVRAPDESIHETMHHFTPKTRLATNEKIIIFGRH